MAYNMTLWYMYTIQCRMAQSSYLTYVLSLRFIFCGDITQERLGHAIWVPAWQFSRKAYYTHRSSTGHSAASGHAARMPHWGESALPCLQSFQTLEDSSAGFCPLLCSDSAERRKIHDIFPCLLCLFIFPCIRKNIQTQKEKNDASLGDGTRRN